MKEVADIPVSADLAWLCSPNNPTGEVLDKSLILDLSDKFRGGKVQADTNNDNRAWVVVDQAYADYTAKPVLAPQEAVETGNVVLLSSLTKRYAVPGLRIGYMVAESGIAAAVRDKGMPWAVNTLAIEAGAYLLRHDADYIIDAAGLHAEALRIAGAFGGWVSNVQRQTAILFYVVCRRVRLQNLRNILWIATAYLSGMPQTSKVWMKDISVLRRRVPLKMIC